MKLMTLLVLALSFLGGLLFPSGVLGISPAPKLPQKFTDRLKNLQNEEAALRRLEADQSLDSKRRDFMVASRLQNLATTRSFAGDTVGATMAMDTYVKYRELASGGPSREEIAIDLQALKRARPEDAITTITEAARTRQIVILNEAHTVPMHRAFAMRLAKELRRIGFEYLACETFRVDDLHPMDQGYVTVSTGLYSIEPTYANFLRDALADGWKFVSYEPAFIAGQDDRRKAPSRDAEMARNIVKRIFSIRPDAKVFIYVGHSHVFKYPLASTESDESRLAAQLTRITGIDPLAIDQVYLFNHYESKAQAKIYAQALKKVGRDPVVLKAPDGRLLRLGTDPAAVDMQVVFPAYGMDSKTNRPTWMTNLAGLLPSRIPGDLLPRAGKRLIYAYRLGDPQDAIPADVVLVEAGKPAPMLMLPKGQYRYEIED